MVPILRAGVVGAARACVTSTTGVVSSQQELRLEVLTVGMGEAAATVVIVKLEDHKQTITTLHTTTPQTTSRPNRDEEA